MMSLHNLVEEFATKIHETRNQSLVEEFATKIHETRN